MITQPSKIAKFLGAILLAGSVTGLAWAQTPESKDANRTYVDPVTGEKKVATKLLSEMTDTEKALLSNEEYRALKELEKKLKAENKPKGQ
jgi:hypothetical protein